MSGAMSLRTVYFESAVGEGTFVWHEGEVRDSAQREVRGKVQLEFDDLVSASKVDAETSYGRLVIRGQRILVEFPAVETDRPDRRVKTTIVVAADEPGVPQIRAVAEQAAQVLRDTGLTIDVQALATALADGVKQQRPFGPSRKALLTGVSVGLGLLFLVWLLRKILIEER